MSHVAQYVENPKGKTLESVLRYRNKLWTQRDPVGALCRHLGSGTLYIQREGKTVMTIDVADRKEWTLVESATKGFCRTPYKPFPAHAFEQRVTN